MRMQAKTLTGIALLLLGLSGRAQAGPGDTPLPTFSDGKPAQALYYAIGVIKNNNLETDFVCTNVDGVPVDIGVEVFDEIGVRRNAVGAVPDNGVGLNMLPGRTLTVGTGGTAILHEDRLITMDLAGTGVQALRNGSARIVATSANVFCTAMLLDQLHLIQDPALSAAPPPAMVSIPLVRIP